MDFQVFVCARAGVRKHVRPSHHCTLGTIVASTGGTMGEEGGRYVSGIHSDRTEDRSYMLTDPTERYTHVFLKAIFDTVHRP